MLLRRLAISLAVIAAALPGSRVPMHALAQSPRPCEANLVNREP